METRWPSQAPAVPSNAIECPVHPMLPQGLQAHLAVCCKAMQEYWINSGYQCCAHLQGI